MLAGYLVGDIELIIFTIVESWVVYDYTRAKEDENDIVKNAYKLPGNHESLELLGAAFIHKINLTEFYEAPTNEDLT